MRNCGFVWLVLLIGLFAAPTLFGEEAAAQESYRKLARDVECPLDYWMVSSAAPYFDTWRSFGVTANHLTLIGGIVQLAACFLLWKRFTFGAAVLWLAGYYFDGIDGSYARYHHLASAYGDLMDHLRDWICGLCLIFVLFRRYSVWTFDYLFWGASLLLVTIFLGVQEQYVLSFKPGVEPSRMLSGATQLVSFFSPDVKTSLGWLRWFGSANTSLFISIYIATLAWTRRSGPKAAENSSKDLLAP